MKRTRVLPVDEENARASERASVHARVFRCGSLPSLPLVSLSALPIPPAVPSSSLKEGERGRESDTRFHLCCLICCRCCRAHPPRLPCLLRVVRSFRICWIARSPFFASSFFVSPIRVSLSLSDAFRNRQTRRDYGGARTRKRVDFWRCARIDGGRNARACNWAFSSRSSHFALFPRFSRVFSRLSRRVAGRPVRSPRNCLPVFPLRVFGFLVSSLLARLFRITAGYRAHFFNSPARMTRDGGDYVGRFGGREFFGAAAHLARGKNQRIVKNRLSPAAFLFIRFRAGFLRDTFQLIVR